MLLILSCGVSNETVVYNIFSAPKSLDPQKYSDNISLQLSNTLFEGLMRYDKDGNLDLALAKGYVKEENKYIFEIKDNLRYSDGTLITI